MTTPKWYLVVTIKTKLTLIIVMLLLATTAFADITVTDTNALTFDINYDSLNDKEETIVVEKTLSFKSTSAQTVSFEKTVTSGYTLEFVNPPTSIGTNDTAVTVKLTAPVKEDAGENKKVATISIKDSKGTPTTFDVNTNVKNMLEIDRIYVFMDGTDEPDVDTDGDRIKGVRPGNNIELQFKLENLFDEDFRKGDIEGTIQVIIDDNDFGDEVDEEESFDVNAGEDSTPEDITIEFEVPEDADRGTYLLELNIEAEDENGAKHDYSWELDFEVEREKYDIAISKAEVAPTTCETSATLNVDLHNVGREKIKYGSVKVSSSQLKYSQKEDYTLSSGSSSKNTHVSKTFLIPVKDVPKGTYKADIEVFYKLDVLNNKKTVDVVVNGCETTKETPKVEQNTKTSQEVAKTATSGSTTASTKDTAAKESDSTTVTKISSSDVVRSVEIPPYTVEDALIAGIVVAIIVVFAMIAILLLVIIRR